MSKERRKSRKQMPAVPAAEVPFQINKEVL